MFKKIQFELKMLDISDIHLKLMLKLFNVLSSLLTTGLRQKVCSFYALYGYRNGGFLSFSWASLQSGSKKHFSLIHLYSNNQFVSTKVIIFFLFYFENMSVCTVIEVSVKFLLAVRTAGKQFSQLPYFSATHI